METRDIKIALLIPHRNDRPLFLEHLKKMIAGQTLQPSHVYEMNYNPESAEKDITQRYKRGYSIISALCKIQPVDLIALIEVDDYYSPTYLETMAAEWLRAGQPDIMGTNSTIYYHLKLKKYFTINHPRRASAMNTFIKPGLSFPWCEDNYAFTDLHLWRLALPINPIIKPVLKGHLFAPEKIISIGMKHGIGLCGGRNHTDFFDRFKEDDSNSEFLKLHCDSESYKFYTEYPFE